ncbi:MAG: DUF3313 family protein [Pseudomonadota bacterium]
MYFKALQTSVLAAGAFGLAASAVAGRKVEDGDLAAASGFERVFIAPVTVALGEPDAGQITYGRTSNRPVSEQDQARKAADLRDDLVDQFSRRFTLVEAPSADALTVETTITRLASTRPTQADVERNQRISLTSTFAGGADFDVVLSVGDGAPLARLTDSYKSSFNDGRPRIATWADADRAFGRFARSLAKTVDGD